MQTVRHIYVLPHNLAEFIEAQCRQTLPGVAAVIVAFLRQTCIVMYQHENYVAVITTLCRQTRTVM
jgi:glutamate-1-semialdehyde aminotransferase